LIPLSVQLVSTRWNTASHSTSTMRAARPPVLQLMSPGPSGPSGVSSLHSFLQENNHLLATPDMGTHLCARPWH
jgi:hypothetical protein